MDLDRSQESALVKGLETAVAAVTLVGGTTTLEQTQALLDRALKPLSLQPHHNGTVLNLLRDLYQGLTGGGRHHLDPLQPDLLGEQWLVQAFDQDKNFLGRVLDGASIEEGYQTLTVLTRLARRRPELRNWIGVALEGRLEKLAEIALHVAVETGDPVGLALAKELETSTSFEILATLQERVDAVRYRNSVPLREVAHVVTERGFALFKERRTDLNEKEQVEYARLANNLGVRLGELGRREDALAATYEAVKIRRQLAGQRPGAFLPDLAMSLNNLGFRLSEVGRHEDALATSYEAVEIRRELARQRPDAFLPDLAISLNSLGLRLSDLGRHEDALAATSVAVEIRRELALQHPDAFLPDLAMSLHNLGKNLGELGRHEDALAATNETIKIRREFARQRPDAFLPDLAMSLHNLSGILGDLRRLQDARVAIQEAIAIYRQLSRHRPDAFLPNLAMSLNTLGTLLSELNQCEEAFQVIEEAVRVLAPSFLRLPSAFVPWMATVVLNYLVYAETAKKEPDESLLAPVREAFHSLSTRS